MNHITRRLISHIMDLKLLIHGKSYKTYEKVCAEIEETFNMIEPV